MAKEYSKVTIARRRMSERGIRSEYAIATPKGSFVISMKLNDWQSYIHGCREL